MPTAIHIHGAMHAGEQPKAKTSQMASNLHTLFQCPKLTKMNFGLASDKTIGQTQAQRHANRKGKNHAENLKQSNI